MKKQVNLMHLVLSLDVGGLEWVVVNLLKRLDRERYNPTVACLLNGGVLVEEIKKIDGRVEILHKPDRLDFSVSFKLAKILKKQKISLIHTHNTGAYLYGSIAAKLAGVPIIIHTEHGRNFPDKKRLMYAEKILSLFTYKIIAVSKDLKDSLIWFEKIDPGKITVIPNGIDLDTFRSLPNETVQKKRYEIGLEKGDFVIGNIGRLAEVKDHKNLIQAFGFVDREIPQAKLVIIGDGPIREDLESKVKDLRLEDKVRFLGQRNDIPELLNTFDIFVLPSKNEGVSLTLLEAMATKKCVVATYVGGNKEIIDDGQDGYLVPPHSPQKLAEAILDIAKNPEKAEELGASAYDKVNARYSLEKMVSDYQRLYEQALRSLGCSYSLHPRDKFAQ